MKMIPRMNMYLHTSTTNIQQVAMAIILLILKALFTTLNNRNTILTTYKQDRNIWHFAITFSPEYNHCPDFFFMNLAQQIALIYCNDYQVYYGLDKDTDNPHIHFAVNAYSYHPQAEPLSDSKMEQLLHYAHSKITHLFSKTKVTLSYSLYFLIYFAQKSLYLSHLCNDFQSYKQ